MNNFENEQFRIDALRTLGKISDEEHGVLLRALRNESGMITRVFLFLSNPFKAVSIQASLVIGILFLIGMSWLASKIGVYFPGAIDLQIIQEGKRSYNFTELLVQNLVILFTTASTFYFFALLFKKRNLRFLDFVGFVALSRISYGIFVLMLFFLSPVFPDFLPRTVEATKGSATIILGILSLGAFIWQIALTFLAQKEASGLKGRVLWITFLCGLVGAEVLSYGFNSWILK